MLDQGLFKSFLSAAQKALYHYHLLSACLPPSLPSSSSQSLALPPPESAVASPTTTRQPPPLRSRLYGCRGFFLLSENLAGLTVQVLPSPLRPPHFLFHSFHPLPFHSLLSPRLPSKHVVAGSPSLSSSSACVFFRFSRPRLPQQSNRFPRSRRLDFAKNRTHTGGRARQEREQLVLFLLFRIDDITSKKNVRWFGFDRERRERERERAPVGESGVCHWPWRSRCTDGRQKQTLMFIKAARFFFLLNNGNKSEREEDMSPSSFLMATST